MHLRNGIGESILTRSAPRLPFTGASVPSILAVKLSPKGVVIVSMSPSTRNKQVNPNTLEQTYKLDGKLVSITKMTVSPDGKTPQNFVEFKGMLIRIESTSIKQ